MDAVANATDDSIPAIIETTRVAFMKLLEKRRGEIKSSPRETFQFGNTDRHQLDVYYPIPTATSGGAIPVLFFFYGGGFVSGDRQHPPPFDLAYSNVGAFFAQRGILTVIPDYRLVPHVKFPQPLEDVRDALAWFLANPATVASAPGSTLAPDAKLDNVFVMGHSAGAIHFVSLYLSPSILPLDSPVRAATRGVIPQGGTFRYDFTKVPPGVAEQYYGSREGALENQSIVLLQRAPDEVIKSLPEVFVMASEREPKNITEASNEFVDVLEKRLGKKVKNEIMKGHNHISPHWALLSGEGEEWGEDVAKWVKARTSA